MIILTKIWKIILETNLLPFEKILKWGKGRRKGNFKCIFKGEKRGEREKKTASYLKLIYKKGLRFKSFL